MREGQASGGKRSGLNQLQVHPGARPPVPVTPVRVRADVALARARVWTASAAVVGLVVKRLCTDDGL